MRGHGEASSGTCGACGACGTESPRFPAGRRLSPMGRREAARAEIVVSGARRREWIWGAGSPEGAVPPYGCHPGECQTFGRATRGCHGSRGGHGRAAGSVRRAMCAEGEKRTMET
ncbi:predicted protein [Streptomyces sp. C]|nr:predicted protein [Streptomyces sp. C]